MSRWHVAFSALVSIALLHCTTASEEFYVEKYYGTGCNVPNSTNVRSFGITQNTCSCFSTNTDCYSVESGGGTGYYIKVVPGATTTAESGGKRLSDFLELDVAVWHEESRNFMADGVIDQNEMANDFFKRFGKYPSEPLLNNLMSSFDTSGDGFVSVHEWMEYGNVQAGRSTYTINLYNTPTCETPTSTYADVPLDTCFHKITNMFNSSIFNDDYKISSTRVKQSDIVNSMVTCSATACSATSSGASSVAASAVLMTVLMALVLGIQK